ncbi:MAG: hypothetical protein MJ061_05715, partial [Mailhella sp.]|nr:hypothetical protein [Mailhella sp.]
MAIQNVNEVSTPFSLDPNVSLQFMYAQLQLIQSETMKKQAMGIMKQIEDTQKEQKEVAQMISRARELQDKAKNGTGDCSGDSHACYMPEDMEKWTTARGIPIESTGKGNRHNKAEWEFNIKS